MDVEAVINPVILSKSDAKECSWEACFSLPGYVGPVERSTSVEVQYLDGEGSVRTASLTGPAACIFQHEVDHLDGKLYIDHISDDTELIEENEFEEYAKVIIEGMNPTEVRKESSRERKRCSSSVPIYGCINPCYIFVL